MTSRSIAYKLKPKIILIYLPYSWIIYLTTWLTFTTRWILSSLSLTTLVDTISLIIYRPIYWFTSFLTSLSLNTKSQLFFHSLVSFLFLSVCYFISFYAFLNTALVFFETFFIFSTNSITFSTFIFLLITASIFNSQS